MERDQFRRIIGMPSGPARSAAFAEWLQGLYGSSEVLPILVGGSAVELFTGGAYVTGDLDFVGTVPASVGKALGEAGFTRLGRHWIHEEGRIFLEFPSSALSPSERAVNRVFHGYRVLIVSPEDLLVDRLSAWVAWESEVDGVNAYLLYVTLAEELDHERISARCVDEDVCGAFEALKDFYFLNKGAIPAGHTLKKWSGRKKSNGARQ